MAFKRKYFVDLKPTEIFLKAHLYDPSDWRDATAKNKDENILWWWCDALFMAPPVIKLYAKHTKQPKYLDDMPKDYKHRAFYENLYKEMAARVLELQPEDGLWRTSLLSPETYDHGEVSSSGFFTFALAWGFNNGLLEESKYIPAVKKAWNALAQCQQDDGKVGWVQNIGAFPEPANKDSWQNFGTGAYLMAGCEVLKLK